jgi:RNase P/RNase MRP subunit p29
MPRPRVEPLTAAAIKAASQRAEGTRTLPVVHGVVLRPLTRSGGKLTFPAPQPEPIKNMEQLMTEADPVKTLRQTGSVHMVRHLSPEALAQQPPSSTPPIRAESLQAPEPAPASAAPVIAPPKAIEAGSPWPSFAAKDAPAPSVPKPEFPNLPIRKAEPIAPAEPKPETPAASVAGPISALSTAGMIAPAVAQPRPVARESNFPARPVVTVANPVANRPPPPALPPMISIGSIAKRKAKLADLARIVLPPKREETGPLPQPPGSGSSAPGATDTSNIFAPQSPAATIAPATARLPIRPLPRTVLPHPHAAPVSDSPFMDRTTAKETPPAAPAPAEAKAPEPEVKPVETKPTVPETAKSPEPAPAPAPTPAVEAKPEVVAPMEIKTEAAAPAEAPKREPVAPVVVPPAFVFAPKADYEAPKLDPSLVFDPATMPVIPPKPEPKPKLEPVIATAPPAFESVPQLDPEAHKPAPDPAPKLDPEAHKAPPSSAAETSEPVTPTEIEPAPAPGTRELHLTNGERVAGVVLSETADTLYIQHPILGVLTVPRDEIATRLAEIILINGDRIVGNIMAETADMLYVRHASLGMLSVPKAQRSRRVVEAILKNGDRILGEVLTETETFTVIKSATLGTVTVPHNKVHMLNRKIEQIEMKALPGPAAQLPD